MYLTKAFETKGKGSAAAGKKRLKIAFIIDVYDGMYTGGILSAKRFVELLRKDHDVTVISSGEQNPGKVVLPNFYIPFVRKIMEKSQFVFAYPRKDILEKAIMGMDIVHIYLPFLLGFKAVKIANRIGVPAVTGFHVQPENILYNLGIRSEIMVNRLYRFFVKKFYNRSTAVICPSRFSEGELKKFGLEKPSYVVSNGLLPQFKPEPGIHRASNPGKGFFILSVGRLAKEKCHDLLIKAISISKYKEKIHLTIAGQGPIKDRLIKMGKVLLNQPKFVFLPSLELVKLYNESDLYVHPSEIEIECMSALESIGCGLPALISDSDKSATKQFALNEKFLFKSNDAQELSNKIDYWIEHGNELKRSRKKYQELSGKYKIKKSVKKLEEIYFKYAGNIENK